MSLNDEGAAKLARMKELARQQYGRLSVLSDAVTVEDYDPSRHSGEFVQLPYRPLMDVSSFNDPNTVMDLVFGEIGRGLAFSETRYLAEHMASLADSVKVEKTPLQGLLNFTEGLRASGKEPSIVFAPIDYYMDWYDDLMVAARQRTPFVISTTHEEKSYLMFPDGTKLRWIWSNKLSPFDDFFVVDKNWARWISKRSEADGERFQITVRERGDKLDIIFRLIFKVEVTDSTAVRRFTPVKGQNRP
jgi:hypothetical protein